MSNTHPRPKSVALNGSPVLRVYRTFEDWRVQQQLDLRTPEERGICVGSLVMWRHRDDRIIVTERATVVAISNNTLTLLVKDVQARTCSADIHEIVNNEITRLKPGEADRHPILANQIERRIRVRLQLLRHLTTQVKTAGACDAIRRW